MGVIRKNGMLKGNDKRRVEISVQEVKHLENILQEILDFAKPLTLNRQPTDVHALAHHCKELLDVKFNERSIQVRFDKAVAIPKIPLDAEKIERAIINLLLNAIDASPDSGTIHIAIGIRWHIAQRFATITICDQGPGIHATLLDKIEKPFFTTKPHGTGLGLTNTARVVRYHGGFMEIDKKVSSGAAVTLMIPIGGN